VRNLSIFLRRGQNRTGSAFDWEGYKTQDSLQTTVYKLFSPSEIKTVTRSCRLHLFDGERTLLLPSSRDYRFAVEASSLCVERLNASPAHCTLLCRPHHLTTTKQPSASPDAVHEYGSQLKWSGWKRPLRHWERGVPQISHFIWNAFPYAFCMNYIFSPNYFPTLMLIITPLYPYHQTIGVPPCNYFVPKTSVPPTAH